MSYKAVQWAMYEAPMLRTAAGEPDTTARAVLIVRAERADDLGRDTYAGPDDVARATGYDERTVRRADRRLEKAGLMIRDGFSRYGTVRWHLDMKQKQADADDSPVDDRAERQRKTNAARQQRFRDRQRAATVAAQSIEPDVSSKITVTPLNAVTNGPEERYVTPFKSVSNGLSAPRTTHEPPRGTTHGTTPGGAPPPGPLRRPPPPASATDERESPPDPLTPAQDQQRNSLPHTRGAPQPEPVAALYDFFTGEAM